MSRTDPLPQVAIVCTDLKLRRLLALEASRFARVTCFSGSECFLLARRDPLVTVVLVIAHREEEARCRELFAARHDSKVLSICAEPWPEVINDAHELGWRMLCQPLDTVRFVRCLQSMVGASQLRDQSLSAALQDMSIRWSLTTRQTEVLALALHGERPCAIAEALGVSHSTFRSHSRGLLLKSGTSTIAMAVHRVLLRALELGSVEGGRERTMRIAQDSSVGLRSAASSLL